MKRPRILVVDDSRDFADGLADVLDMEGYVVRVAYTGEEALAEGARDAYDLALVDIILPGLDGAEVARRLRGGQPGIRVVMMTGYSDPELLERASEAGNGPVIEKPVDIDRLLGLVARATGAGR